VVSKTGNGVHHPVASPACLSMRAVQTLHPTICIEPPVRLIKPVIISVAGARNEHRHAIRRSDEAGKNRLEQTLKGCLVEFDRPDRRMALVDVARKPDMHHRPVQRQGSEHRAGFEIRPRRRFDVETPAAPSGDQIVDTWLRRIKSVSRHELEGGNHIGRYRQRQIGMDLAGKKQNGPTVAGTSGIGCIRRREQIRQGPRNNGPEAQ
jgi:hypothetical protein